MNKTTNVKDWSKWIIIAGAIVLAIYLIKKYNLIDRIRSSTGTGKTDVNPIQTTTSTVINKV